MDSARAATAKPEGGPAANEAPPAAASNGTTPNSANGANGANGNSANPNWWRWVSPRSQLATRNSLSLSLFSCLDRC